VGSPRDRTMLDKKAWKSGLTFYRSPTSPIDIPNQKHS
jgi:hypothetical protein